MTELFRRRVIELLVERELLAQDFARNLLSWKHSGFSIDNSVRNLDESSQESLAELTQHIPPKRLQLIRRYGLYASRTKGRWEDMPWVTERAPDGWKASHQLDGVADDLGYEPLSDGDEEVTVDARKRAWVQRFSKRYRKPEGPGFLQRSMRSIRLCAQSAVRT